MNFHTVSHNLRKRYHALDWFFSKTDPAHKSQRSLAAQVSDLTYFMKKLLPLPYADFFQRLMHIFPPPVPVSLNHIRDSAVLISKAFNPAPF